MRRPVRGRPGKSNTPNPGSVGIGEPLVVFVGPRKRREYLAHAAFFLAGVGLLAGTIKGSADTYYSAASGDRDFQISRHTH